MHRNQHGRGTASIARTLAGFQHTPVAPRPLGAGRARLREGPRHAPARVELHRRVWRPALEHVGLAQLGYRFHDLRHTCVSRLVAAGADVKLVQAVAGHASPLITLKRYSHLLDTRISEAADRFDPARIP